MFKWVTEAPRDSMMLGEGTFTALEQNPVVAKLLLQIPQGEYVVRMLSSHLQSIVRRNPALAERINPKELYYVLGEPRRHPDGAHILVPFSTYYIPKP